MADAAEVAAVAEMLCLMPPRWCRTDGARWCFGRGPVLVAVFASATEGFANQFGADGRRFTGHLPEVVNEAKQPCMCGGTSHVLIAVRRGG